MGLFSFSKKKDKDSLWVIAYSLQGTEFAKHFSWLPIFMKMDKATDISMERCQSCRFLPSCGGGCMVGRYLSGLPFFCEISFSFGEEHMKMCLKQQYPELLKSLKIE